MVWTEIIVSALSIIILTVVVIIGVRLIRGTMKIDVVPNAPLIDNTARSKFTDGYSFGIVKSDIPRKNDCHLIEYFPLDWEQGENKPRPPLQSVVVHREFLKRFSQGESSSRRQIVRAVSRDPTDLPHRMQDTSEGKWMTKEGQLAHLEKTLKKGMIVGGDEAIYEMLKDIGNRNNLPKAWLAALREENAEARKIRNKIDSQQEPSTPDKKTSS